MTDGLQPRAQSLAQPGPEARLCRVGAKPVFQTRPVALTGFSGRQVLPGQIRLPFLNGDTHADATSGN